MLPVALEQERSLLADRILSEIESRHGFPHPRPRDLASTNLDRYLVAYVPETRDGEPAPLALEYAFTPTLTESLELLRRVVHESPDGHGTALYVHDLDMA